MHAHVVLVVQLLRSRRHNAARLNEALTHSRADRDIVGPMIRREVLTTDIRVVRNGMVVGFGSSSILRVDHLAQLLLPLL